MTVAEMTERMSLREYVHWIGFLRMETREQERALKRAKARPKRRR